ncbi:BTB/POZ domain-containing protein KCTD19-like [Oncorhynchus keta]|uniref:BTB/POZ domain-containing protein KCTD19-like n=1 Tax=Oncorhynchus keta TaxID=8018 RepID=UPI00227D2F7D|nr:BTB/POZ domain-containing protein KCTD19-like [Oncorhynchus keta]XP_052373053.1 BTB/POZ domain-containing protein KCTD19-like [Oncorhynchus keta]XP_052373054.1 BTB/POZ domain-containing protein KCTD19-like [Oncorhynchus keta]XP_052373055.1 BTB/POZ domain-containing protein KCTD19-like [Oncorhynchus keta]XP_052373056.1 BTB/POZ domain-containing protein KCTD19-like [Oncorhynchus keta]XP_052373057.1 BTB/POZ domain-containing protein KCTD19-like [Oncorhynchus keta]XP_052373058.1 BTB/POZ domain
MVFGRQCHVFLTGLILDSIRLEDSKDCTLKITNLVYFLWTGQVKAEDFVSELLRIICSERREKSREQLLLQWLEPRVTQLGGQIFYDQEDRTSDPLALTCQGTDLESGSRHK